MSISSTFENVMDVVTRVLAVGLFFIWGAVFFRLVPAFCAQTYEDWYFETHYGNVRQVTQEGHWSTEVVRFVALLGSGTIGITVLRIFDAVVFGYVITKGWCNIFHLGTPDPVTNLLWWLT